MRPGYNKVAIHFEGELSKLNRKPMVNTILQGLLSQSFDEVNAVNATMLAKERGIDIAEVSRDASDHFNNLIRLEVEGDDGYHCLEGTLFDAKRARLVSIDTCDIELAPEGSIIYLQNLNKPGVVASVGAVLAEADINIADFRLGRRGDDEAIALVCVDSAPSEEVLDQLMKLPNMVDVRYIEVES